MCPRCKDKDYSVEGRPKHTLYFNVFCHFPEDSRDDISKSNSFIDNLQCKFTAQTMKLDSHE